MLSILQINSKEVRYLKLKLKFSSKIGFSLIKSINRSLILFGNLLWFKLKYFPQLLQNNLAVDGTNQEVLEQYQPRNSHFPHSDSIGRTEGNFNEKVSLTIIY